MGAVSIDIHKAEREFHGISLSDINVVRWLISHRDQVDIYYGAEKDLFYDNAGVVKKMNQELIHTYAALDELIEQCNFTEHQKWIINLISIGYTNKDIEDVYGERAQGVDRKFSTICKKIVEMNDQVWISWAYKYKLNAPMKKCTKCDKELPLNLKFFSPDARRSEGFSSLCKKCDSYRKKRVN